MKVVRRIFVSAKSRIDARLSQFTDIVRKIISIVLTITVIGWCATFIYFVFYLYYVPIVYQEKPVYFHFSVCESGVGMCTFPTANISLTKDGKNEVFKVGQSYKIVLDMDIPESDINRNAGMFMIEIRMFNKRGETVQTSSRASSLHYKSSLLRTLETLVFAPFFLFGYMEQKQFIHVELFPDFIDNAFNPSVGLVVEIQSRRVEVYQAKMKIFAQFSGVRYFLYYWPLTSAVVGISIIFNTLGFIVLMSLYQFWPSSELSERAPVVRVNLSRNRKQEVVRRNPHKGSDRRKDLPKIQPAETVGGATSYDRNSDDNYSDNDTVLLPEKSEKDSREDTGLRLRQTQPKDS